MLFFKRNWSPLFISGSSFFFVIHANVDFKIKVERKNRLRCCCFLSLKVRVAMRLTAEARAYLKCEIFTPASMKGWTYVRTYSLRAIFSEPKFSGLHAYFTKFSYPWCSATRACARELSYDLSSITWTLHQNAERLN